MEQNFTEKDEQWDGRNGKDGYGIEHIHNHLMRTRFCPHQNDDEYKVNEHKGESNRQANGKKEQKGRKKNDYKDPPFHLVCSKPFIQYF
jgi:hypothetical protein